MMRLDDLTEKFVLEHGAYCAVDTFKRWQIVFYTLLVGLLLLLLAYRWDVALCLVTLYLSFWYLSAAVFRCARRSHLPDRARREEDLPGMAGRAERRRPANLHDSHTSIQRGQHRRQDHRPYRAS